MERYSKSHIIKEFQIERTQCQLTLIRMAIFHNTAKLVEDVEQKEFTHFW
jgi:hypothetical protein